MDIVVEERIADPRRHQCTCTKSGMQPNRLGWRWWPGFDVTCCRATTLLTCNKLETGQVVTRSSGVQNGSLVQRACWAAGEDDPVVWQWCIHRHSDGHRWCSCVDTPQAHAWTQMKQLRWQARMDTAMGTSPLGRTDEGSLCRVQYGWILGDPRDREMELILSYHKNWVIPDPCHIL